VFPTKITPSPHSVRRAPRASAGACRANKEKRTHATAKRHASRPDVRTPVAKASLARIGNEPYATVDTTT